MMEISIADDITISGTVIAIENGYLIIETAHGNSYCIVPEDVKTVAPGGNNGGGKRSIIKSIRPGGNNGGGKRSVIKGDRCITKTTK